MQFSEFVILLLIVFFVPYLPPIFWLLNFSASKKSVSSTNEESDETKGSTKEARDALPLKAYLMAECAAFLFVLATAFFVSSYGPHYGFIDPTKLQGDAIKDKVWAWQTFRIFESVVGVALGVILLRLKANRILYGICFVYGVSVPSWINVLHIVIIDANIMH